MAHRVVVIGSGFGGLFAAKKLKRADVEVTVISRVSHHLFQPLLYQVATGILSQGEIAPATREILKRQRNADVLLGEVTAIDLTNKTVTSQVAMQGAKHSARTIRARLEDKPEPGAFDYFDKGSMATISRFRAVANVGKLQLRGFLAWMAWLFIHILYLVGFQQKVSTLGHWMVAFLGRARAERTFTLEQARGSLTNEREARPPG